VIRNVLVGLDGGEAAEQSLAWLKVLAPGARLTLLRAYWGVYAGSDPWMSDAAFLSESNELAVRAMTAYLARMAAGIKPTPRQIVRVGSGAAALLDAARERKYDLIAITSHGGNSLKRRLLGGTTEQLIHHTDAPLLVVPVTAKPESSRRKLRRIAVPLDASRSAEAILPIAEELARLHKAELVLIHAFEGLDHLTWESGVWAGALPETAAADRFKQGLRRVEGSIRTRLQDLVRGLRKKGVRARAVFVRGDCPQALIAASEGNRCGLMAMSVHGHGALQHLLQGSLASRILQDIRIPVLLERDDRLKTRRRAGTR